jgi:hypothetical protein
LPAKQPLGGERIAREGDRLAGMVEQGQVAPAFHRHRAQRAQERAVPLGVDHCPARRQQPGPHVGDGDGGRARVPAEQRVPAQQAAQADADRAAD